MKWNHDIKSKNLSMSSWYIYKILIKFFYKVLGLGIKHIRIVSGVEIELNVNSNNIYPLIFFLNKHTLCQFKSMVDIIMYDMFNKKRRFFIIYNILSVNFSVRTRVISKINEFTPLLSTVGLFKSVNWSEREVYDFFGIFFILNNDLRRILTDYGFSGYPLRKDFPLTGFIETHYDDNQKRICYRKLELSQEYRSFNFRCFWKVN